ncbi:hypothetical protein [Streptomyces sp. SID10815]|uniref:hypothetical protein n=1 Tax=Streptomyces sp. SID10815 TaxID=2706027 RepID=UPI0013C5DB89|nr:hypothetical protein [Streptomyces sp. SID10815]NEA46687.1 hypothetical protein [Streptomyces sp. SID10815]
MAAQPHDGLAAFCQILTLRYRDKIGLAGYKGTYTMKYSLWPQVSTEPLGMRTVEWTYKVASSSRETYPATTSVWSGCRRCAAARFGGTAAGSWYGRLTADPGCGSRACRQG